MDVWREVEVRIVTGDSGDRRRGPGGLYCDDEYTLEMKRPLAKVAGQLGREQIT